MTPAAPPGGPLDLVYVAGAGREGSTLLEMLLNAHSQVASCGELQIWPRELVHDHVEPCGCGRAVLDCPFWRDVHARVDPWAQPEPRIHHFRAGFRGGRRYRRGLVADVLDARPDAPPDPAVRTYGANNHAALRAVADVWEAREGRRPRWLVDASKDPYRLFWLLRSGFFRIRTLHLVRDPRGYVRSAVGVGRRPLARGRRLREIAVQAAVWRLTHDLVREVVRRCATASDVCEVSYERLAMEPEATLRRVCETIGCDFEPAMIEGFRDAPRHTISGNAMRFERGGIELDEDFRRALSRGEQALALGVGHVPARALRAALAAREALRSGRGD